MTSAPSVQAKEGTVLLKNKTIIITGAAGGIGRATTAICLREGANVALVDENTAALGAVADSLTKKGFARDRIATFPADVTHPSDVASYITSTSERFGTLDILFNNAGSEGQIALTGDYEEAVFDHVMTVNVKGVWLNLKYGINAMLESGGKGVIINTSSALGLVALPGLSAYVASKHAVAGLTRTAALEYGARGVRVIAICPGPVDTPMMESLEELDTSQSRAESHDAFVANVPLKRYGRPNEIGELVAFLASDRAKFINGAAIAIDGGATAT